MDIRSFFGGGGGGTKAASAATTDSPTAVSSVPGPTTEHIKASSGVSAPELSSDVLQPPAPLDELPDMEISADIADIIDWSRGTSVPYKAVADAFEKIGATSGRLEKESILCR